jgi:hypothetical protein
VTKRKQKTGSRRTSVRAAGVRRRTSRTARAARPPALRWNPDPEDVQRSVVQLVLSLIEFIRKLMERQAVRRLEEKTLTPEEIENVGLALMKLEQTIHDIAKRFKLDPKDLNLDLGPVGRLH